MTNAGDAMDSTGVFATYPSLSGRVVVVTGGASGIGEAIVGAFATQKARVAFLDIQDDAAGALVERVTAAGAVAPVYHHCELTDTAGVQRTVRAIVQDLGAVDVLVNNAGDDTRHAVADVTPAFWDRAIAVNLTQQFFVAQAVIPSMRKARRGSIINMSSIGWVIPSTNQVAYVASKAAIVGLSRALAHELGADNIRVNSVMPGAILTERQQRLWLTEAYKAHILANQALKRMILPEEVARLVLFLASDDSAAITSQSYVIDAGWV